MTILYREFIRLAEDPNVPSWQGYVYAILMFATAEAYSLLSTHFFQFSLKSGMNIRTVLMSAVFKKVN